MIINPHAHMHVNLIGNQKSMRVIYVLSQFRMILFHSYFNLHKTPTRTNQQKSAGSSPRFPEIGIQSPPLELLIAAVVIIG